jgi:hypothetical protein
MMFESSAPHERRHKENIEGNNAVVFLFSFSFEGRQQQPDAKMRSAGWC